MPELLVYLSYTFFLCSGWLLVNYIAEWKLGGSSLGFCLAFLNYSTLGRVFGVKTPERSFIRARVVLDGNPEQLAKAFTDTHCELRNYALAPIAEKTDAQVDIKEKDEKKLHD